MRLPPFTLGALLGIATMAPCNAQQTSPQIMQDAATNGAAASTAIQGAIANTNTSGTTLPSISPGNLAQQGQSQAAACQSTANDPDCDAINTAVSDAALRQSLGQPVTAATPEVQAAQGALQNPTSVIAPFNTSTSPCASTPTAPPASQTTQIQSCYNYYTRDLGLVCQNNLQVNVTWYCNSGDGNPVPTVNGGAPNCQHTETNAQGQVILGSNNLPVVTVYPALPIVNEYWSGCGNYDARVPPGLLLAEGDNSVPPPATGPGVPNLCERTNSVCSVPGQTINISGLPVYSACWQYTDTFDCLDQSTQSDCNAPWVATCTPQGGPVCVDTDPLNPALCETWQNVFVCPVQSAPLAAGSPTPSVDCSNQTFADGQGNVWNVGHPSDQSFIGAVTGMESLSEAGKSMNQTNVTVLGGEDDRCRISLFGIENCCNPGGTSAASTLTDRAVAGAMTAATLTTLGLSPILDFSPYTYNALFPATGDFLAEGGSLLTDVGGLVVDVALPFTVWAGIELALQLSGLIGCNDEEKNLAIKRDAQLCVDIGEYCSESTPIIHICIQHTHTYCCFNSQLAEAINVQGKAQLGISMGTPQNPNCGGLTVAQFQSINLSTMNLSAFQSEISPYGVDNSQATTQANATGASSAQPASGPAAGIKLQAKAGATVKAQGGTSTGGQPCFFGAGKCEP